MYLAGVVGMSHTCGRAYDTLDIEAVGTHEQMYERLGVVGITAAYIGGDYEPVFAVVGCMR